MATVVKAVVIPHDEYSGMVNMMGGPKVGFRNRWGRSARHSNRISAGVKSEKNTVDSYVPAVSCPSLAAAFGRPYVIKIDIENKPSFCVKDLCDIKMQPYYVSLESQSVDDVAILEECGYSGFKLVSQSLHSFYNHQNWAEGITTWVSIPDPLERTNKTYMPPVYHYTASGTWGEEALDWVNGKKWRTAEEIKEDLQLLKFSKSGNGLPRQFAFHYIFGFKRHQCDWFDIHARLR